MATINFTAGTVVPSTWLNDVDAEVYDYIVNVKREGALGNGVANDAPAIKTAAEKAMTEGKKLYIPGGTYLHTSVMAPTITADLEIIIDANAIIKGDASINNRMWFLSENTYTHTLKISGSGLLDGSLMPNSPPGSAWDIIYTGGWAKIVVDGLTFYHGADYRTAGSDSSLFVTNKDTSITNCTFIGAYDIAIYLSGDSSSTNGWDARINGCKFYGCQNGIAAKRKFRRMLVEGNSFEKCSVGVFTGEADSAPTKYPGMEFICNTNTFERVSNPIVARIADGSVIEGNIIRDYGFDLSAVAVTNSRAITIQGCKYVSVLGNFIAMDTLTADVSHAAISLVQRTIDATTIQSTDNLVAKNVIINSRNGISEGNTADRNRFIDNMFVGTISAKYTLVGATSMYRDFETTTPRIHTRYGSSGTSPVSTAHEVTENDEAHVAQVIVPDGTSWTLLIGDVSNNIVARIAYDHGTDRWSWRAGGSAGSVFELDSAGIRAGTFTGTGDTATNGYVTIKDLAGNTRKLATIA